MWERNIDQLPPVYTLTRDWTRNPGMCLDQELNPQPFLVHGMTLQPTEPPGQDSIVLVVRDTNTMETDSVFKKSGGGIYWPQ